ncbi:MAG TPA: hypothetical protein VFW11_20390 [Cyclobacteriaceae bacterium]|nr:hypothetical protein [Cyclobacteriaceae bacterium]
MKLKRILVYIYNSFDDPLFQGLLLNYIKELVKGGGVEFHVITFEQEQYQMTVENIVRHKRALEDLGIYWHPLRFHTGRFLLLKKGYDFLQSFLLVIKLNAQSHIAGIISFANIAGVFGYLLSKIIRSKIIVFSYEPHSQFLLELNIWKRTSLQYRILNYFERLLGRNADYIFTGTKFMVEHLKRMPSKGEVYRLPTSVNDSLFSFSEQDRRMIRQRLGLSESDKVVIYTGKFGYLYYKHEIFDLVRELHFYSNQFFFIFLTSHDRSEILSWINERNISLDRIFVDRVPLAIVPQYLSASDLGIVAVANFPSKRYCSPTKVGEYLCNGIPYIVTQGTSEDDIYALQYNVGVVIDEMTSASVQKKIPDVLKLLNGNKDELRQRCRRVGVEYRALDNATSLFRRILDKI